MVSDRLTGVVPILAMPFAPDGSLDLESLEREVDFLIGAGVRAIGFGFATEGFRMTGAELLAALQAACERAAGRVEVMAHVPANSVAVAVDLARGARGAGAGLLMVPVPSVVRADERDLFEYFKAVAGATRLPMVVQDAPGLTGANLSVRLLVRLLTELDEVVALKIEHVPSVPKIAQIAAAMSGHDGLMGGAGGVDFYFELERGASGTMPGAALPELFLDVLRLHRAGDRNEARRLFNLYLPLLTLAGRSLDTFLWVQKEILRRRGVLAAAHLRAPSERLERELKQDLDTLMSELLPYPRPAEVRP